MNAFGNGWCETGRQRYCHLMSIVNESRAFYNASFDTRMTKFSDAYRLRQQRKKIKQTGKAATMTTEFNLPTIESIRQEKPNEAATALDMELMNFVDPLPNDSDRNINNIEL